MLIDYKPPRLRPHEYVVDILAYWRDALVGRDSYEILSKTVRFVSKVYKEYGEAEYCVFFVPEQDGGKHTIIRPDIWARAKFELGIRRNEMVYLGKVIVRIIPYTSYFDHIVAWTHDAFETLYAPLGRLHEIKLFFAPFYVIRSYKSVKHIFSEVHNYPSQ